MMALPQNPSLHEFACALRERYGTSQVEPLSTTRPASGSIINKLVGSLKLTLVEARCLLSRRPSLSGDLRTRAFLLVPTQGELIIEQYEHSARLTPGRIALLDSQAACTLLVPDESVALCLDISRFALDGLGIASKRLYGREIEGSQQVATLLSNMMMTIADCWTDASPQDGALFEELLVTLLRKEIFAAQDPARGWNPMLIDRMRAWIIERIEQPGLSPEALTREFGLSRRTLYRLFSAIGTTPARWLWGIRLDCARDRLSRGERSVAKIAYAVGFNDTSHFTRLFRRRFGELPRNVRSSSAPPAVAKPQGMPQIRP